MCFSSSYWAVESCSIFLCVLAKLIYISIPCICPLNYMRTLGCLPSRLEMNYLSTKKRRKKKKKQHGYTFCLADIQVKTIPAQIWGENTLGKFPPGEHSLLGRHCPLSSVCWVQILLSSAWSALRTISFPRGHTQSCGASQELVSLLGRVRDSPPMPCRLGRTSDNAQAAVSETSLHQWEVPRGREYQSDFQHSDTREKAAYEAEQQTFKLFWGAQPVGKKCWQENGYGKKYLISVTARFAVTN